MDSGVPKDLYDNRSTNAEHGQTPGLIQPSKGKLYMSLASPAHTATVVQKRRGRSRRA
jgi:hypothetical protein